MKDLHPNPKIKENTKATTETMEINSLRIPKTVIFIMVSESETQIELGKVEQQENPL